jgi:MGT family glycosyltransferase
MGTVNNNLLSFYKTCLSAFENTPYQVILSVGNLVSLNEFGKLPEHISVFSHVDQIAVLEKADVFISHCGMNSVNESLYFGVPLIMLPQTSEQSGVAERVSQLGAGIRLHKPDADAIQNTVEKIFADSSYKQNAHKISDGFQKCSGSKGAADKILQVCENDAL